MDQNQVKTHYLYGSSDTELKNSATQRALKRRYPCRHVSLELRLLITLVPSGCLGGNSFDT